MYHNEISMKQIRLVHNVQNVNLRWSAGENCISDISHSALPTALN